MMIQMLCLITCLLLSCGTNRSGESPGLNSPDVSKDKTGNTVKITDTKKPGLSDPDHFDLQSAIDSSSEGDTIWVPPGTYYGNFDFHGRAVVVKSEEGPENTVLDGNWQGSVMKFQSGEDTTSVLDGFTVTHGTGTGESMHEDGGGIYIHYASAKIVNNIITDNKLPEPLRDLMSGGGIFVGTSNKSVIRNNTITGNIAGMGGGIYTGESNVEITGNYIAGNEAASTEWGGEGGGIFLLSYWELRDGLVSDNIIINNRAHSGGKDLSTLGGGILSWWIGELEIRDNFFIGNTAVFGGGIDVISGTATILKNVFYRNKATGINGYIYTGGKGGAIRHSSMASMVEIYGNTIVKNEAYDHWDEHGLGGGIESSDGWWSVANNIIVKNVNGGICCREANYGVIIYNDVWDNTDGDYQLYASAGQGCISEDPLFKDVYEYGYTLQPYSPCIDAGKDLGYEYFGKAPDMGAWEYDYEGPLPRLVEKFLLEMREDVPDSVR